MKTTNRASRKAGKNSRSAQSPKTTEKTTGGVPKEDVTIRLVTRAGKPIQMEVSSEMAERIKRGASIKLGSLTEMDGGIFKGQVEIGAGIREAIIRYSEQSGARDFYATFAKALQTGLTRLERQDDLWAAMDRAENTKLELMALFTSLRDALFRWQKEGMPPNEAYYDLDHGLLLLTMRLEESLSATFDALRNGSRNFSRASGKDSGHSGRPLAPR